MLLVPSTENHLSSFKCGFLNIFSRHNLSLSLNRFVLTYPSTIIINKQLNSVLSTLQSIILFLYNVSHFDRKCCESHLSLSSNRFVLTYPLTIIINNQLNSVLSVLQSIIGHSLSHASGEKDSTDHFVWVCELKIPKPEHGCKIKLIAFWLAD